MLPLWIVDLRKDTRRREIFESLLGEIRNVYIPKKNRDDGSDSEVSDEATSGSAASKSAPSPNSNYEEDAEKAKRLAKLAANQEERYDDDEEPEISVEELIAATEKKKARRESYIDGKWWRYSPMADKDYGIDLEDEDWRNDAKRVAESLYKFQSDLVKEGQEFIRYLRKSNARPDIKLNVIVLGDIEEEFTRVLFPSIAGMIQKEKGRILPHHIHQGMEIIGMLYIPSNINTLHVELRDSMQRTLKEIDVQHNVPDMRGYDHMMLYQDVQNRTECVYPALEDEQLEQYLIQCIINLYLASDESHPLLSGTASAESFYFSMGATSVCYDVENEDRKARHDFGVNFMRSLKKEGEDERANLTLTLLDSKDYSADKFFDSEAVTHLDTEEVEAVSPNPHPIKNFTHKYLKKSYYQGYLRKFTKNMMEDIRERIEETTRGALEIIASKAKVKFRDAKKNINEKLKDVLAELSNNEGGLPTIIRLFREMQEQFSNKKKSLQAVIESYFWENKVMGVGVPKRMRDRFNEYHEAYREDIRRKTGGTLQAEMKKEIVTELNDQLSREATMLSRICRSILLGIMLALAVVPLLNLVSPHILNLGRVRRYAEWWSVGLFFFPILLQLLQWFRYERKKRRLVNNLKALFLHDAYARVANRMETEIRNFYDKMIALAEKYVKRTERIRDEIEQGYEDVELAKAVIPETMFNQPLLGGQFGREKLLPTPEAENTVISINFTNYKTGEISDKEYFMFMNQHHRMIHRLFDDVDLCENLIRRTKPTGEEELVTKEQQEQEQEEKWRDHKRDFHKELSKTVQGAIVPRINDTVGEVLVNAIDGKLVEMDIMEPLMQYAANNGEITSSADLELTDVKINDPRAVKYLMPYVSSPFKNSQVDRYNHLYKKYIFVTRWRCFDYFPLNRILPMEDFDEKVRSQLVWEDEQNAKKMKYEHGRADEENHEEDTKFVPYPSSLLLWALSPDDSSTQWFRLLDSENFHEAYEEKEKYKEILNQND